MTAPTAHDAALEHLLDDAGRHEHDSAVQALLARNAAAVAEAPASHTAPPQGNASAS